MIARIEINNHVYRLDLSKGHDISLAMKPDSNAASAWYVPPVKITPVRTDKFVGDVNEGGSVNFNDIVFNPHGNGTHTESVGHISKEHDSVNQCLERYFFSARLISVAPETIGSDKVITEGQIRSKIWERCEAIVIRTLPNSVEKKTRQYSNSNPPYISKEAVNYLLSLGIDHLLIDLPSVDKEFDNGVLAAHHEFWNYPANPQRHRTITEFIYAADEIPDGFYLINMQVSAFENDAAPSRPVLYSLVPEI